MEEPGHSQAESASEKLYQTLYMNAPVMLQSIDRQGRVVSVNEKWLQALGYEPSEVLGRHAVEFVTEESRRLSLEVYLPRFMKTGVERGLELQLVKKNGEVMDVLLTGIRVENIEPFYGLGMLQDVTELKRTQEALQKYTRDLQELVEERTAELRRSEERQRVLLEVNNAVISNLTRDALFGAITRALGPVIPYDLAALTLFDPEWDVLRVFALHGSLAPKQFPVLGSEVDREGSHLGWVLDHQQPMIRGNLEKEHQFLAEEKLIAEGIRSFVVVPLLGRQGAIGTLNVASRTPNQYSDKDAELLLEVAKQIALAVENMLAYEEITELKGRLEQENLYLQEEIKTQHKFEEIVGRSGAIRRVLRAIETVAPTDATVLILGETGTGKELIARALHQLSPRKDRALITVNCAALPAGLIESELFGHERGAFTGALSRKIGRFELADGGSILLDEIGDLPLDLQAKLLRVLQDGEFERVGGSQTIRARVRVIAATNRDLEKALQAGTFREDLYFRLNVFPIQVPPLRERKEDIPHLVRHLTMKYNARFGRKIETISQARMKLLQARPWPGNVRELENVIERAVILSRGPELDLGELQSVATPTPRSLRSSTLAEIEREHIVRVLESTDWHVSGERGAAKVLGMKRTTLQGRMRKLGIRREV